MAQRTFGFLNATRQYFKFLASQAVALPNYGTRLTWDNFIRYLSPRPTSANMIQPSNLAAYYPNDPNAITLDGSNNVILWADRSGNSATNCMVNPTNSGGGASTPSVAANRVTGDFTIVQRLSADTLSGSQISASKDDGSTKRCYSLDWSSTTPRVEWSSDGSTFTTKSATTTIPYATNTIFWIKAEFVANNGAAGYDVRFYTAADTGGNDESAVVWVQLGSTVTTAGVAVVFDSATQVFAVGVRQTGNGGNNWIGRTYYTSIRTNVSGAIGQVFAPAAATKLASSFVSSTGETWTIATSGDTGARISGERDLYQGTAANRPAFTAAAGGNRAFITFDGVNDYLKSAAFNLNQPETVYLVARQITWTSGGVFLDGVNGISNMAIVQAPITPNIRAVSNAGSSTLDTAGVPLGQIFITSATYDTVNSSIRFGRGPVTSGNLGAGNGGGVTLGARSVGDRCVNAAISELVIYSDSSISAVRNNIISYLASKYSIGL